MQAKKRLLVIGDYKRNDFLDAFYACRQDFEFYFLEYAYPGEVTSDYYKTYGKLIFWKDFSDAFDLIDKIKPFKVVFYFIETFNHVALNVACRQRGIKTYHLDHGFRDIELEHKLIQTLSPPTVPIKARKKSDFGFQKITDLYTKLKTRLFFYNTVQKSGPAEKLFLREYFRIRKVNSISQTFRLVKCRFRVAEEYISYSPANFQQFILQDHLEPGYPVHYIGVPGFDKYANVKPASELKNYLILISQPFVEQGWLGWTIDFERTFIQELADKCSEAGFKLLVKLHPYQNVSVWKEFSDKKQLGLVSETELVNLLPYTKLISGFFSTLLIPLAALPHTTVLTFENHPVSAIESSAFLRDARVSYQLNSVTELPEAIQKIGQLYASQVENKAAFASNWLFRFDGLAGKRLREVLLKP